MAHAEDAGSVPRDALAMNLILRDMGVQDYDEGVVGQLLELLHCHVTEVAEESAIIAQHCGHEVADPDDVKIAIRQHRQFNFTQAPTVNIATHMAAEVNARPLPSIPLKAGMALPAMGNGLDGINYEVVIDPNRPPRPEPPSPPPLPPRRRRISISRPTAIRKPVLPLATRRPAIPKSQPERARLPQRTVRFTQHPAQPSIRLLPPRASQSQSPQRSVRRADDRRSISKPTHRVKASPRTPVNIRHFRGAETAMRNAQAAGVRLLPPRRPQLPSPDRRPTSRVDAATMPSHNSNLASPASPGDGPIRRLNTAVQINKASSRAPLNRSKLRDVEKIQQHARVSTAPPARQMQQQHATTPFQSDRSDPRRAIGSYWPETISKNSEQPTTPISRSTPARYNPALSLQQLASHGSRPGQQNAALSYDRNNFRGNTLAQSRAPVVHSAGGPVMEATRPYIEGPNVGRMPQQAAGFSRAALSAQPNLLHAEKPAMHMGTPIQNTAPIMRHSLAYGERRGVGASSSRKDVHGDPGGLALGQLNFNEPTRSYPSVSSRGAGLTQKSSKPLKKSQKRSRASQASARAKQLRLYSNSAMPPPPEIVDLDGPGATVQPPPPLPRPTRRKSNPRSGSTRGRGRPPGRGKGRGQGEVITIDE